MCISLFSCEMFLKICCDMQIFKYGCNHSLGGNGVLLFASGRAFLFVFILFVLFWVFSPAEHTQVGQLASFMYTTYSFRETCGCSRALVLLPLLDSICETIYSPVEVHMSISYCYCSKYISGYFQQSISDLRYFAVIILLLFLVFTFLRI